VIPVVWILVVVLIGAAFLIGFGYGSGRGKHTGHKIDSVYRKEGTD